MWVMRQRGGHVWVMREFVVMSNSEPSRSTTAIVLHPFRPAVSGSETVTLSRLASAFLIALHPDLEMASTLSDVGRADMKK